MGQYLARTDAPSSAGAWIDLSSVERTGSGVARVLQACYWSDADTAGGQPFPDGPLTVGLAIETKVACTIPSLAVTLYDMQGTKLVNADTVTVGRTLGLEPGTHRLTLRLPALHLNPGVYQMGFWLAGPLGAIYDHIPVGFEVEVVALQAPGLGRDADRRWAGHLPARAGGLRLNRTARRHRPAMWRTSSSHSARNRLRDSSLGGRRPAGVGRGMAGIRLRVDQPHQRAERPELRRVEAERAAIRARQSRRIAPVGVAASRERRNEATRRSRSDARSTLNAAYAR